MPENKNKSKGVKLSKCFVFFVNKGIVCKPSLDIAKVYMPMRNPVNLWNRFGSALLKGETALDALQFN